MAPIFGMVWQPVFDTDELPDTFGKDVRKPLLLLKGEEPNAGPTEDHHVDSELSDVDDEATPTRNKRASSSAGVVKAETQYGDKVLTPRELGIGVKRKAVLMDMDSDDEIIWTMKSEGYKDEPVAARLIVEGRTHYDPKTIATRFSRMRRIQAVKEEQELDEDFSDYHEAEDNALEPCLARAQAAYEADLEAADQKRWATVASYLNEHIQRKKYTKTSARTRWEALQSNTAIPPLEQDPNAHIRIAHRTHERQARDTARREAKEDALRQKRELRETRERQDKENTLTHLAKEEERKRKRLETEAVRLANREKRARHAQVKAEENETRTERNVRVVLERERRKKDREEERAARAWRRVKERRERREEREEGKLRVVREEVERKTRALREEKEHLERAELIRRVFRGCGIGLAAPIGSAGGRVKRENFDNAVDGKGHDADVENA